MVGHNVQNSTYNGLHVLTIVMNDGAYGSKLHKLKADGVSPSGSIFGRSDFAGIGRGFGIEGESFVTPEGMKDSFKRFPAAKAPAIWDVHISDKVMSPQILRAHHATHASVSSTQRPLK